VAASNPGSWAYPRGTRVMFLAEYYLRTRDLAILPGLQKAVNEAQDVITADFVCGHKGHLGYGGSGYIGATGTVAAGLAIASKCPVFVDLPKLDKMLERVQGLAGESGGQLPYGRSRSRGSFPTEPSDGQWGSTGAGGVLANKIRGGPQYINEIFHKKFGAATSYGDIDGGHATEALTFIMGSLACGIWGDDAHQANMNRYLWRLTLKRDFSGYINNNTNRLEYHGADGAVHGGPIYDTGGYLILFNIHKKNLAITGLPAAQAQVFPNTPPTHDADLKLYWRVLGDWNMVDAALGSKMPASLQPKLAGLRAMPPGTDLADRTLAFLQREGLAAANLVNVIPGLTSPERQYYCEMLLGIGHEITVGSIDRPVPTTGLSNYRFSVGGYTAYSTWSSWSGSLLSSDPASTTQMTGSVTLTDPSGTYLATPRVLNFTPASLNPTTDFQVPVNQQVNMTATFNYTVGGSLVLSYTRDIIINPTVPFITDNRAGDFNNVRKVWIPGNCPMPFGDWNMPIQLPSGETLPGASKSEGGIGFHTYDNGELVSNSSNYTARIRGNPAGFWLVSADRYGECAVLGVNLLPGPVLITANVSAINPTAATAGGTITSNSNWPVSQRGVCWSTTAYPTVFDTKTSNGGGTGTFTSSLTGLLPGTMYYVRAYAINAMGISYGANVPFTTAGSSGTWTTNGGGSWPTTARWLNAIDASGADGIADFGTVSPASTAIVTLDGDRSIGGMVFGNAGFTGNWVVSPGTGGSLAMDTGISGDPTVTVNGGTATLGTVLTGFDGLIKAGPGTLVLSAANLFSGITAVNAGTLQVDGSLSNGSPVSVAAAGTLSGTGTLGAATTVNGALSPGIGGIGTLTFNHTLTLLGGVSMEINKTAVTCDKVTVPTHLTYGGSIIVTNLAGTLAAGDKFVLFTAGSYSGSFSSLLLPSLTAGLKWDTSGFLLDGSILVGFDASITGQPTSQSVAQGVSATFTVTATGLASPSYQWQVSLDAGATWTNVTGATASSYTAPAAVSGDSGKRFRCVVFNSLSSVNSTAATLTVTADALPSFTTQPLNTVVPAAGQTATFTATATGTPTPTLQWQVSTNQGGNWTNVSGASSATYSFTSAAGDHNTLYRCVATNNLGSTNSNAAQLIIAPIPPIPIWTNSAGGSWTTAANWSDNTPANGSGVTADFSRLGLTSPVVVALDGARTIGNLHFGTSSGTHGWTLNPGTGGPLTLAVSSGTPTITVSANSATIATVLAGTHGLTKTGAGTLILSSANTFTGGTTLVAGQLNLNSTNSLAGGPLVISGGALGNSSGTAVTLAGAQSWNGNFSYLGPNHLTLSGTVALGSNRTVTVDGGDLTLNGIVSGAFSLTKDGANTLTVSQENNYSGGTIVNAGKLIATGGGWSRPRSIGSGALTVNPGATVQFTQGHGFGVDQVGRSATLNGGTLQFDRENYMSGLTMTGGSVTGGGLIRFNWGLTVFINASSTGSTIGVGMNLISGTTTLNVANGTAATDLLMSGSISHAGNLVKSGDGFMKLTGSGSYGGTTSINAGSLQLAGGSLGGGNVSVASTATLAGAGSIGGSTTVNGILIVGVDGATGTINLHSGLTLAPTSQTTMKLKKTSGALSSDLLTGISTLTCGGTLTVTASGDALEAGDSFQLLSAATISGTFASVTLPTLGNGLIWDTSQLYLDGSISLGKKSQSITFGSLPAVTYGSLLPLTASVTSGLHISYSSSNPAVAIIQSGNDLTAVGIGTTTITASQSGNTAYLPATAVSRTLVVGPSVPVVNTISPILLSSSTASSGGTSIWDGGDAVTERGVCWSTSVDPTVADSRTLNGSGTESFTSSITGLLASTTYYFRAYARNSAGYGYGDPLTLIMPHPVITGVWTNPSGGSWPTTDNWQSAGVPTNIGSAANFGTLNISAARTVTLDTTVTLSGLTFGDTDNTHGWTLNTGTLGSLSLDTFTGTPSVTVTNQTTTINTPIAGASGLIKTGAGTLVLGATNPLTGPVSILGGIVRQGVNTTFAPAINLTITNAALEVRYGYYNINWIDALSLSLGGGATLRAAVQYAPDNGDIGFKDTINVIGTNTVSATGGSFSKHNWLSGGMTGDTAAYVNLSNGSGHGGSGRAIILESAYGNWTDYYGTLRAVNDATIKGTVDLKNATVIVDGAIGLYGNGAIGEFGELRGVGTHEANGKTGGHWKIGNLGTNSTYGGVINGASQMTKVGTGALTLTNASTCTGGTTVSAGILLANNPTGSATGSGAVTVSAAGTLGGTGIIGGATTVLGTLAPGSNGIGTLTINNTLNLAGTTTVALNRTGATLTHDKVQGVTTLTYGGTLAVTAAGDALTAGSTFTLFAATTYAGSFATITLPSLDSGLQWDTSALGTNGSLTVRVKPDANDNGIIDAWEESHFGNANPGANPPLADADGDGLSNLLEFAVNTHPKQPNASPLIHELVTIGADKMWRLTVPKNPLATNLSFTVETCADLTDWSSATTHIETNTATQLIVRDTQTGPPRFIRLVIKTIP
jgi:fibronectin-binding autotransporter adhesin